MTHQVSTETSRVVSRPATYIMAGWLIVVLAVLTLLLFVFFPNKPQPQYPDAMTPLQAMIAFPGTLLLVALWSFWLGYRACIIADEEGVSWRVGLRWTRLRGEEVTGWALQYNTRGKRWEYRLEGSEGQSMSWQGDWSSRAALGALIARKRGRPDAIWPVRFMYSRTTWIDTFTIPPTLIVLVSVVGALWGRSYLLTFWRALPHSLPALVLFVCVIAASMWVFVVVRRWTRLVRQAETRHAGEAIEIDEGALTWSDGGRVWRARLEEVRFRVESNDDWVFEMPQGEFVIEPGTCWRAYLRQTLDARSAAFHLNVEESSPASSTRFGFDTRSNKVASWFFAILFFLMWLSANTSRLIFQDENSDTVAIVLSFVKGSVIVAPFTLLGAWGWYASKKLAFEVSDEGLWYQGLWKRQLMRWEEVEEVGTDSYGQFVRGRIDGSVVRWNINPLLTNERPVALQRAIKERAPRIKTSNLL